jgi:hypothetical protein
MHNRIYDRDVVREDKLTLLESVAAHCWQQQHVAVPPIALKTRMLQVARLKLKLEHG